MRAVLVLLAALLTVTRPQVEVSQDPATPAAQVAADAASDAASMYAALRDIGVDTTAALRITGVKFSRGPATFLLDDGVWLPFEPVGGRVTGAVFIGEGRVFYDPPSGVERDQLVKFTDEESLTQAFDRIYLRFTDATAAFVGRTASRTRVGADAQATADVADSGPPSALPLGANDLRYVDDAEDLHDDIRKHFIEEELVNLESRILIDLAGGRNGFFSAWIETRDDGPLHFEQDPMASDLFRLRGWTRFKRFDQWGGFGAVEDPVAKPIHYSLEMTLDGGNVEAARAELELVPRVATRVLRFEVHPLVEMQEVFDADGQPLFFVQEEAKDDLFERAVSVFFDRELAAATATTVTFEYDGELVDTLLGGGEYLKASTFWYPGIGYLQRATFDMTFRVDDGDKVFASGVKVADEVVGDKRVVRFEQQLPVALVSYNYGSMEAREVEIEGVPPIMVFGFATGFGGDALGNVGIDIGNSLRLFSEMFGDYPFSYMSATRIPGNHGQGFPGLLHLAASSFGDQSDNMTAFRAHEVAHQWWGHMVGWKSYRDQWISEGFAEYSGALYVTAYEDDLRVLDKMTAAWRNDVFKRGNAGFRRFGMPAGVMQRRSEGTWSGPITLGYRLSSSETPVDYQMLAYEKGAYILHMLRMAMYDWTTGSDEPFRVMMRDFVATHLGGEATTESFRAIVEKHIGEDMGWFFDQWVYGTAVPTYRFAWKVETLVDGQSQLRIRVRQSVKPDVPVRMIVPVRLDVGDDRFVVVKVLVDKPYEEFTFNLPDGFIIEDVIFNPRNAVLAEVDEESW